MQNNTHSATFIVGPTASGKSSLALQYAKVNNCHILSADSRQIYQGIEITSGADIPNEFDFVSSENFPILTGYFSNGDMNIYGISALHPTKVWSVGRFQELAYSVFERAYAEGKGVVIVGGSGLYTHSLLLRHDQLHVPPNEKLRKLLEEKNVNELQDEIQEKYPQLVDTLNQSDWNNPRRLIRLLEILHSQKTVSIKKEIDSVDNVIQFQGEKIIPTWIGKNLEKDELQRKIIERVKERITHGAIQEIERLYAHIEDKKTPILTATGVKEIVGFLHEQYDEEQLTELWSRREFQYAKRQMTWFKKRNYIQWRQK